MWVMRRAGFDTTCLSYPYQPQNLLSISKHTIEIKDDFGFLKPEGKGPLGRPRSRWEDNIKADLQEVGCGV
jgi:hypothetical protein